MVTPPKIYSCSEWGAVPADHAFSMTRPTAAILHHMATPNRPLESSPALAKQRAFQLARDCQQAHMGSNGWADTGQNFTVSRDGVVLEGRHGSLIAAQHGFTVRGAHAADGSIDYNQDLGIENEGTYSTAPMPKEQWNALVALLGWLTFVCGVETATIIGHRDTGIATACPGNWLESQLPELRHQARLLKLEHQALH